jgi:DNA polymerase-3 subunit beta
MRLTIERAALLRALGHVQSVVERRNTIPILSNVLLRAEDGQLSLSATDMDLEMVASVAAQGTRKGATTAPAHTLYDIVRKLREGAQVEIDASGDKGSMTLRSGRSVFTLACLPPEDYPLMAGGDLAHGFTLSTTDLKRLIDRTRFAISTEETRYYLNGLYLHVVVEDGATKLRAVATDSRRLALAEMPAPEGYAGAPGVIIPRKTINEVRRLLDDAGESVTMAVSTQKVRFGFGHAAMTSKVIDGSFPPYERVIPRDNKRVMMLDNTLFGAAVDRVATISNEQSRAVKLSVETGRMTLTVRNMDAGQAVEELEVDYEGEPFEIGFNARYLLDLTGQVGGELAEFRFAEHTGGATVLDPTLVLDPTDAGVQYVLMPLRA